jgi:hypothetical protein
MYKEKSGNLGRECSQTFALRGSKVVVNQPVLPPNQKLISDPPVSRRKSKDIFSD